MSRRRGCVYRIDARRVDGDPDLAGAGYRVGDIGQLEHPRATEAADHNGSHSI